MTMEQRKSPGSVSSRRRIKYRSSEWCVHEFEVWSGAAVCRAAMLRVEGSLLVWLGGGGGAEPRLVDVALGMPAPAEGPRAALVTTLLGSDENAAPLALRLASTLARPVYVFCGTTFDRFTLPLVERALIAEIKSRPHCS